MRPLIQILKTKKEVQMPMYNGSAQMAMLPYDKQLIIDAKIPLFELEKRSSSRLDSNDFGYANVKAIKNDNSNNLPIQLIWYSGKRGYVRYSRDRNGRYLGYCPDDPEWFNRTKLSSSILNSNFKISKYIDKSGLVTVGSEITEEINYIGTMIHDWVAKIDNRIVIRSKDIREVEEYVTKKRTEGVKIQGPMMGLIEKLEKIREFHKHDWMFSPEYQNEVIPEMKRRIDKKFNRELKTLTETQPEVEKAVTKLFPEILSNMSVQQLTEILKKKMEEEFKGVVIKDRELLLDGIPLGELPLSKIRTIAVKKFNIKTKSKTREELIKMIDNRIKKTVKETSKPDNTDDIEDVNDILGPPTEEEIKNRAAAGLPPLETVESI